MSLEDDKLITVNEVISSCSIGRNSYYEMLNSGEFIKPVRIPGIKKILYSNREFQIWLSNLVKNKESEMNPSFELRNIKERERSKTSTEHLIDKNYI